MFKFQVINRSNAVIDVLTISALATQITRDFASIWGADGQFGGFGGPSVPLYVEQTSDVPGALGYHDIDSLGNPFIKVFVDDSLSAGVPLSAVMSHEILEVLGDPFVDSLVLQMTPMTSNGVLYFSEMSDPVEGDLYTINGVSVSNFITPQWFMPAQSVIPGVKYDFLGKLTSALTMTPGGYFITYNVSNVVGPSQTLGRSANPWNGRKF